MGPGLFEVFLLLLLLVLGYLVGSYREKRHFESIFQREAELQEILVFESRQLPVTGTGLAYISGGQLVHGNVVISVDYFKRFVAGLRMLIGGRMRSYESLLDRGRREAVLRMKAQAREQGAEQIFNVRFETASISKGEDASLGSIEVFVYGSAISSS
ncbi:MAG: heavy metal-binding domain-containing protein [Gammaproteobacteria bacterium]|nr:heavy metal-binding domain-containing protein [Gammaproteobacteria bacterium]